MEETEQTVLIEDDPDATMVAPRFDEEELETAQPVVPLAAVAPETISYATTPPEQNDAGGARRTWPLALVLISALAGSALGMAGLYFYQQRQESPVESTPETSPQTTERVSVPVKAAPTSTPTPATTAELPVETTAASPTPAQVERPAPVVAQAAENDNDKARAEKARDAGKDTKKDEKKEDATTPPRKVVETEERTGTIKHGKKGEPERHDEAAQFPQRPRRVEAAPDSERAVRRIDSLTYPENRRARREPGQRSIDRVRGIFEGQPPN